MNHPKARNTDPKTSHVAAEKSARFAGGHRVQILQALKEFGAMSPPEIAKQTGLTVVQIDRRRSEMLADRVVRIKKVDGMSVVRWGCQVLELV